MSKLYAVWCGGGEVNNYYFDNYDDALKLAQEYIDNDYDDVHIISIKDGADR